LIKENIYIFKKDYGVCYTNNNLEYFIFDLEDYELISERIWTRNKQGYFISKYRTHKNQILLHRLIIGSPKGMDIDHINGDKQDNRRLNLRITTRQQNSFNKHPINKIMGIYYEVDRDKWCAMLYIKDKGTFRKRFATQEEAIKYRLQCELQFFGKDFAPQRHLFKQYDIGV